MANGYQTAFEAPYMEDYRRRLLESGFGMANMPTQQYQQGIASFAPQETAAFNAAAQQMGYDPATGQQTGLASYQPYLAQGQATMGLGLPALQQATQQYDPTMSNTQDFMNQYQAQVTQKALEQMDQEAQKARNRQAGEQVQQGVFGGSRAAVAGAELDKNLADIKSRRIFEDLSQNFMQAQDKAIGTSESARARQQQAASQYGALGANIANIGAQEFQLGQQGIAGLLGAGATQRQRNQALEDAQFRFKTGAAQEPRQRLQYLSDLLNAAPSYQSSYGMQQQPYTNPLLAGIGGGLAGLGAYGALLNPQTG